MRVLISDKLPDVAVKILTAEPSIEVDNKPGLPVDELKAIIGNYDGIIIRSGTKLTADILDHACKMKAIARAGVGVDNVDVKAASRKGIIVMNTPGGNTTSTAEHTVAMLLALARNIPQAYNSLKSGQWDRKSFVGTQLSGKNIGIIGLGRIGLEVAKRCLAFEMKVLAYDPYISPERAAQLNIELTSLQSIWERGDFITVHTPMTSETRGLIGAKELAQMKKEARIINCARGGIVDEEALADALQAGKVAGAAIDVFSAEPPTSRRLIDMPQVLCTPHLGASTEEAQINVSIDAAAQLVDALTGRGVRFAVNLPSIDSQEAQVLQPYSNLAEKMGCLLRQLGTGQLKAVEVCYTGDLSQMNVTPVTRSLTAGLLKPVLEENVNLVNAPVLAEERGISIIESRSSTSGDYTTTLQVKMITDQDTHFIEGALFGKSDPRIVNMNGYHVEVIPRESLLVIMLNKDRPGLIGEFGRIMAKRNINISSMTFGCKVPGGDAMTVLNLDAKPCETVLEEIRRVENVRAAVAIEL
ncbi:MAG TPA: phosphoglycerate dehydrogenase [Planctomycetota bacterium]|nr:phosphoglycerate dehydrogenase [Planctomycetota bacterium]